MLALPRLLDRFATLSPHAKQEHATSVHVTCISTSCRGHRADVELFQLAKNGRTSHQQIGKMSPECDMGFSVSEAGKLLTFEKRG
jgi:hypothetical protein